MEAGFFVKVFAVSFCGILLFFLGFAAFSIVYLGLISLIIIVFITASLSYYSRNWLAGLVIGMVSALTFLLGYLTFECLQVSINPIRGASSYPVRIVLENVFYNSGSIIIHDSPETWIFLFLRVILGFGPFGRLPSILSAVFAFGSIGAFSGLVGYISKQLSPSDYETQPLVFRDYWSQYYGWNKSHKREYRNLDRKLAAKSFLGRKVKFRLQNIFRREIEPETELVFIPDKDSPKKGELPRGNLHSFHSGRLIGNFVDCRDLIGKFEPKLVHSPLNDIKNFLSYVKTRISSMLKREKPESEEIDLETIDKEAFNSLSLEKSRFLKWLKLRELFENNLNWILKSILVPICFLAIFVFVGILLFQEFSSFSSFWVILGTAGVGIVFGIVFVWVLKYWKESKRLLDKRSDENIFILLAYIVFVIAVIYVIPNIISNSPEMVYRSFRSDIVNESNWVLIPQSWFGYWLLIWTKWFVILSVFLAFGYLSIHREAQTINVYFFDKDADEFNNPEIVPFRKESGEVIEWIKEKETSEKIEKKPRFFWVIRYMYFWPVEITTPPHDDWERIEVWIDAVNGELKWVVSDYHYRELWYQPTRNTKLSDLKVFIAGNFHTPVPILEPKELSELSSMNLATIKSKRLFPEVSLKKPKDSLKRFVKSEKTTDIILAYLITYPWSCMRYLYGTNYEKEGNSFYKTRNSTYIERQEKKTQLDDSTQ